MSKNLFKSYINGENEKLNSQTNYTGNASNRTAKELWLRHIIKSNMLLVQSAEQKFASSVKMHGTKVSTANKIWIKRLLEADLGNEKM